MPKRILLLDEDPELRRRIEERFDSDGWSVVVEPDGEAVAELLGEIDAAVLDMRRLGLHGFKLVDQIRAHPTGRRLPLILLSGPYRGEAHKREATERYRLLAYLDRPIAATDLVTILERELRTGEADGNADLADHAGRLSTDKDVRPNPTHRNGKSRGTVDEARDPDDGSPPGDLSDEDAMQLADDEQVRERRDVERTAQKMAGSEVTLRGSLAKKPFPLLLHQIYREARSGALFIQRDKTKKIVYFDEGTPVFVKSNRLAECLGRILVRERFITAAECEESLRQMKSDGHGRPQGATLIAMRLISPHNLRYCLEQQLVLKLLDIFSWENAEFRFRPDLASPSETVTLDLSSAALLIEGIRHGYTEPRLDAALAEFEGRPLRLATAPFLRFQQLDLDEKEQHLFARLEATPRLSQLIDESALPPLRAKALVYALLCAGVVEAGDRDPSRRATRPSKKQPTRQNQPPRPPGTGTGKRPRKEGTTASGAQSPLAQAPLTEQELAARLLEMRQQDHYALLGIGRTVHPDKVSQAFFALVESYHPDRFRGQSASLRAMAREAMDRIVQAYEVLSDATSRKRYDRDTDKKDKDSEVIDPAAQLLAADRYFRQGKDHLQEDEPGLAKEAIERAATLCPDQADYQAYLGLALFRSAPERANDAIVLLRKAAQLNPKLEQAYLFLGMVFRDTGDTRKAEFQFERALQCNPSSSAALTALEQLSRSGE